MEQQEQPVAAPGADNSEGLGYETHEPSERQPEQQQQPTSASASLPPPQSIVTAAEAADEKGQTFRKRRLSLTNLKQQQQSGGDADDNNSAENTSLAQHTNGQVAAMAMSTTAAAAAAATAAVASGDQASVASEEEMKAQTFRKRRLSLTHKREEDSSSQTQASADESSIHHPHLPSPQRKRRYSDTSIASILSNAASDEPLKSRIVHASELLAQNPPPSPAVHLHLYQASAPPQQHRVLDAIQEQGQHGGSLPKWQKRHTRNMNEDERKLPFPRDIVGTFSCHGVEPISDTDDAALDYEDDDEDWAAPFPTTVATVSAAMAGGGGGAMPPPPPPQQPVLGLSMSHSGDHHDGATTAGGLPIMPGSNHDANNKLTTAAKINQDRGGVASPYGNCSRTALFAVYDGHGQGGESVAQFALHEVQRRLEKHKEFVTDVEKAFKETFVGVDKSLEDEELIEPRYSGTTACVVLLRQNTLIVSNAGDSRAVLARLVNREQQQQHGSNGNDNGTDSRQQQQHQQNEQKQWEAINLSIDQNPDLPAEQHRIEQMGGFVSPPPEPGLSARVWLDPNCTQIGLAMARSIGDHAVKPIGVIAEPVVKQYKIHPDDDFMILATDGVWEFISSEEAVKVVSDNLHLGATKACQALIEAAAARWHDEEGDYRDDITALVIRLQHLWPAGSKKKQKEPATYATK